MQTDATAILAQLRRRQQHRKDLAAARAQRLLGKSAQAAALLRDSYDATDVILFGSLASGSVHPQSDIDLAVRGLRPGSYVDALAALMELFDASVDLVEVEKASPSLRKRIDEEGQIL